MDRMLSRQKSLLAVLLSSIVLLIRPLQSLSALLHSRAFLAVLITLLANSLAFGATVNQEKERLLALQQNLASQEENLLTIKEELRSLPANMATARANLSRVEADYLAEKTKLDKIKAEHAAAPSRDTERQLRLSEINAGLAERRVRTASRELERLEGAQTELQADIASTEQAIKSARSQISRQEQRVAQAEEEARQEQLAAARAAAAPVPAPTPKPVAAPIVTRSIPVQQTPAPVQEAAAAEPPVQEANSAQVTLSQAEYKDFQFAQEQMAALEKLVSASTAGDRPKYASLDITGSSIEDTRFTYLGNQQYRADVKVSSGRQLFRIEDFRFRATIPEFEGVEEYVFLVDARSDSLRASYFKKSLLAYVGKELAIGKELGLGQDNSPSPAPTHASESSAVEQSQGNGSGLSKEDAFALEVAREEMARIKTLLANTTGRDDPLFSRLTLSGSNLGVNEFNYIGRDQYRLELPVSAGRHSVKVNTKRFRIEIPEADDGEVYVFLVDASRPSRLQMTAFKKSLLSHF